MDDSKGIIYVLILCYIYGVLFFLFFFVGANIVKICEVDSDSPSHAALLASTLAVRVPPSLALPLLSLFLLQYPSYTSVY